MENSQNFPETLTEEMEIAQECSLVCGLLDDEAKEIMEGTEEYEADREAANEADEAIAAAWNAACEDANDAWVQDEGKEDAAGEDEEDDDGVYNLRDPMELEMAKKKLLADGIEKLPSAGAISELALFYLGRGVFVHIYGRAGEQMKLQISQTCKEDKKKLEEEGLCCTCAGLVIQHDEWVKLMYYKRKLARLVGELKSERYVDEKCHLGNDIYVSVTHPFQVVNFRRWFRKDGTGLLLPSKAKGIALKLDQYNQLLRLEQRIHELNDRLADAENEAAFAPPLPTQGKKRKATQESEAGSPTFPRPKRQSLAERRCFRKKLNLDTGRVKQIAAKVQGEGRQDRKSVV